MRLGLCPQETPSRVRAHLTKMGMKVSLSDIPGNLPNSEELIKLMKQDKKAVDGKIAFIMAKEIGNAFILPDIDLDNCKKCFKRCFNLIVFLTLQVILLYYIHGTNYRHFASSLEFSIHECLAYLLKINRFDLPYK